MTLSDLFYLLNQNDNGELSRSELHESAHRMRWHWREAPVFAVLDLLTILKPISKKNFIDYMTQMMKDPLGPYGKVLLHSPHFLPSSTSKQAIISKQHEHKSGNNPSNDIISLLKHLTDSVVSNNYHNLLKNLDDNQLKMSAEHAALLIIDPQRSFTRGVWMKSTGPEAELEVNPIRLAFEKCAHFLNENYGCLEIMFTRCPFPPHSYDWDDVFTEIIDSKQLYFIKPGNSVLFPATNGFREWTESLINNGKKILVMGGCTLNSCVRVSSIETQRYFKNSKLQTVVDLSLSGARTSNFLPSSLYGGLSAVESAVREMINAGIRVAQCVKWTK